MNKTYFYFPATCTRKGFQRVEFTSPLTGRTYSADIQHHLTDAVKMEDEPTQEAMKALARAVMGV